MKPEKILSDFLWDWLSWAAYGSETSTLGFKYSKEFGLCTNLNMFCVNLYPEKYGACILHLHNMFRGDGLDTNYPFGVSEYFEDMRKGTQHQHAKRLAWVLGKIG